MYKLTQSTSELMNYEQQSSNSNNYSSVETSSSPESFPTLMQNGILVHYESIKFSTNILEESDNH